jgi:hypothetical protein
MNYKILLFLFSLVVCSDNHIVQRAMADYFLYEEGNWWRYVSETDTVVVEVEAPDTLLGVECSPISVSGTIVYWAEGTRSIDEYALSVYNFAGEDYTILEGFITRIEVPLVEGNTWQDSVVDSLNVAGQWVTAKFHSIGTVTGFEYQAGFEGDVYTLELTTMKTLISPDTTIVDTVSVVERYAPAIGLVSFENEHGEYHLDDYAIQ